MVINKNCTVLDCRKYLGGKYHNTWLYSEKEKSALTKSKTTALPVATTGVIRGKTITPMTGDLYRNRQLL